MKAIAVSEFKGIPTLMDLPKPAIRPGAVLIKVQAAGINPFDWKMIDGIMNNGKTPHQFPLIMGVDGAGIIDEVGEGVTRFKKGDLVYGQFIHMPIGEGSYAEYAIVPEKSGLTMAPMRISPEEAAAVPTSGMTALQMIDKLKLKKGDVILINGATGGVGSFATQIAAAKGLKVLATVGDDAAAKRMHHLGAAVTINYKKAPVFDQVKAKYPQGIDGLIDLVSNKEDFHHNLDLLKEGGGAFTTVFVADEEGMKARNLHGGNFETEGGPQALDQLSRLIDQGQIKVPVENRIKLEDVPGAIEASRNGKATGKTVIVF
ncbi:NADP-dependent oxidoreductase [Chitinophaga qingshengii]|uniref:NADP-dependent oxidoreductase n=1 Tax=Chitinophaga qingshengii TaxID=1569794 RepID=A0ABR7TTD5_9BACT|nr:NADP-dependent oxidoreductase [Chitinophaga qingshengii]MBC9933288.1 NADP-dependent oxidoreductase [Chitinophaga qingshengii]